MAPTSIQLHNVSTSPFSLVLGLTVSSSVDTSVQEKEGEVQEWDVQKIKKIDMYVNIYINTYINVCVSMN